jgi:hypothetical protein
VNRRRFLIRALYGLIALILAWLCIRRRRETSVTAESPFDRVVFVCCNDHGECSPGIYLHGPAGGGPACLSIAQEAAHCMRAGEAHDSAAGLCGYLFTQLGPEVTSGGGLSLWDAPRPLPDGSVDWQAYCSWNVDLILINVDRLTAECFVSPSDPKAPSKSPAGRLTGLKFGG